MKKEPTRLVLSGCVLGLEGWQGVQGLCHTGHCSEITWDPMEVSWEIQSLCSATVRGGLSSKRNQGRAAGSQDQEKGLECVPKNSAMVRRVVYCSPLYPGVPYFPLLPSFQIFTIKEENNRLMQEKQILKNKLEELKNKALWNNPMMMSSSLPEKKVIFKGLTANKEDMNKLMLTPLIHYPLPGGSALITFEEAKVAQRIIEMREHTVELSCGELEELDQCRMRVQAVGPVGLLLLMPWSCPGLTPSQRSILLSALPSLDITREALLDKLELFFSKKKNGGSEVESREFLEDSDQVVMTFTQDGVAEPLIEKGHIQVPIGKGKYKVKISPCMSGDISNLQLQPSRCPRTVLLLGIPDVLSEESMRDALEIHFQKASRGGGEVDALAYVPAGRTGLAVFVEDMG
uniref:Interferon induced protein 35 n=1 Tax=Catharus ustulatus TaxID=91951 RepID=A0A8C3UQM2_CATUS